jgi:2,3-bisphosphoglycerate-dependent phosphoglycerate mutase
MKWRRSYDTPPPPITRGSEWDVSGDPRYAALTSDVVPLTECLADVVERLLPVLVRRDRARPAGGRDGAGRARTATRCARLVKHLDRLSEQQVVG